MSQLQAPTSPSSDDTRGFKPTFDPGTGIFTIWIARWLPGDQAYFMISDVAICQLMLNWGTISASNWSDQLLQFSSEKIVFELGNTLKWLNIVLSLKLEGMTKE